MAKYLDKAGLQHFWEKIKDPVVDYAGWEEVCCALRKTSSGWVLLNNSGHTPKHISSVEVYSEDPTKLVLYFDKTYSKVGTIVITPDETLTKAGIYTGASVAVDKCVLEFYRNRPYGGFFNFNGANISYSSDYYKGDIDSVTYHDGAFWVAFKDYCKGGFFTTINVTFGKNASNVNADPSFASDYEIKIAPTSTVGSLGDCRAYVWAGKMGGILTPEDFPVLEYSNFWVYGLMKV